MTWRRMLATASLFGLALAVLWAVPGEAAQKDTLPPDLGRVPPDALGLLTFRPAEFWGSELGKTIRAKLGKEEKILAEQFEKALGIPLDQVERVTTVLMEIPPRTPLMIISTLKPYDAEKVIKAHSPGAIEVKHMGKTLFVKGRTAVWPADERVVLLGSTEELKSAVGRTAKEKGPAIESLLRVGIKHSAVVAVNPQGIVKLIPGELPREADPFKPLLKARHGAIAFDLGERAEALLKIDFADADDAKAAEKVARMVLKMARDQFAGLIKETAKNKELTAVVDLLKVAETALKEATLNQVDSELQGEARVKLDVARLVPLLLDAQTKARQAALRMQSVNNLKQIGLAFHIYHDAVGQFPPQAVYDKDGKALLSWRVLILPYLEQDALYKEFKLNEPWDSPHNRKLLARMPKIYQDPTNKTESPDSTYYQGFAGPGAIFDGKKGIRIVDISDGTSNTVMIVEAGNAVEWTKPEDLPFKPKGDLPKLGGLFPQGFNAVFADGSVRLISKAVKESTLRAFITRNGGEVIPADE